jgi:predicted flap endonuclease-1-like 5' DNA nuclease
MTEPTGADRDLHRRRLAARIAEERRKRAGRAAAPDAAAPADAAAMQDFLTRLTGGLGLSGWTPSEPAADAPPPVSRAVLPFPAPVAVSTPPPPAAAPEPEETAPEDLEALATALEAACDLDRLPGAGPGLVWALRRAGLRRLDDLAGLEPEDLAERLGPVGLLVPLERWIGVARDGAAA